MQERKYYDIYDIDDNVIASHLTCDEVHEMTGIETRCMNMYVSRGIVKARKWRLDNSYDESLLKEWDRTVGRFKRTRKPRMLRGW